MSERKPIAYDRAWSGYAGKAARFLKPIAGGDDFIYLGEGNSGPIPRQGEWLRLGAAYNVGAKFLHYMVDAGLIVRRGDYRGDSVQAWLADWYRLNDDFGDDFGDLWV